MLVASSSNKIVFNEWTDLRRLTHVHELDDEDDEAVNGASDVSLNTISWSADGSWMVYVTNAGTIEIIGVKDTLKLLYTITGIDGPSCASFSHGTKKFLAIGCVNGRTLVYDIKNKCERANFVNGIASPIYKVSYVPSDTHVLVGCKNGELLLFNVGNASCIGCATYPPPDAPKRATVTNFRCHPNDVNLAAVSCRNGIVAVWNLQANETAWSSRLHDSHVIDAIFVPQRTDLIASIAIDKQFHLYDTNSDRMAINVAIADLPTAIDAAPYGDCIVIGTRDGAILPYDLRNTKVPLDAYHMHEMPVKEILFQKHVDERPPNGDPIEYRCDDVSMRSSGNDTDRLLASMSSAPNNRMETATSVSDSAITLGRRHAYKQGSITEGVRKLLSHRPNLLLEPSQEDPSEKNDVASDRNANAANAIGGNRNSTATKGFIDACILQRLKEDVVYEVQDLRSQINMRFLDLQMLLVKEFLQIEYEFNGLKETIAGGDAGLAERVLAQENVRLKMENEELKAKLRNLNN